VYVVDQGSNTVDWRPGFAEMRRTLGRVLRYLRQPNLGGAGGFTRGVFEAVRNETAGPPRRRSALALPTLSSRETWARLYEEP